MARASEEDLRELARSALQQYDLPPEALGRTLSTGNNATFEVQEPEGARLVVRVHRPAYRTIAQTSSELRFLQSVRDSLRKHDVIVAEPVPTRTGELVAAVTHGEFSRHCDVLTWVSGRVVVPGDGLGPAETWRLGAALAHLHNASQEFGRPSDVDLPAWDRAGMFTAGGSPFRPLLELEEILSADDLVVFAEIAERAGAIFDRIDSATGLIHIDYILGNCLVSDDSVAVVDFDDCGYGDYLYDLAPILGNFAGYPGAVFDNPEYPSLRDTFLSGYRTAREFPVEWEQHLPVMMAARHANHTLLTAGQDVSPTPREDAAWRMDLARRSLDLAKR